MKKILYLILVLSLCMVSISLAVDLTAAAGPAPVSTPMGDALRAVVNDTVIPLIVAVIMGLLGLALLKIKSKLNIQLKTETENWIKKQAESAVQMVAEKSASKIKYNEITLTKNEKLDLAIAALVLKTPKLTKEQADAYIHAALARIKGAGATGDNSLTAPAG